MRELKRSIAKSLMSDIPQKFKKKHLTNGENQSKFSRQKNGYRKTTFFALHWREYVDTFCGRS